MNNKILLSGAPRCGKTTLVRALLPGLRRPAGGFFTEEVRSGGERIAFDLITLDGARRRMAGVDVHSRWRVGRYGVDVSAIEQVAVPAICQAWEEDRLVVIDELGPMEFFSTAFCQAVEKILLSPATVLGTIVLRNTPFGDRVKALPGIDLVIVTPENRERLLSELKERLAAF